jgi:tRNA-dependent cyclodipeptide synthase
VEKQVKIKASFVRAGHLKDQFKEAKCALPISVGQPYHEGEKFKATIELLNKHFKECMIIVCDSLQRHTLAIYDETASEEELRRKAVLEGDLWIERNLETIKRLKIPYQITRWDEWLLSPEYQEKQGSIECLYAQDEVFKKISDSDANIFLKRMEKRIPSINNMEKGFERCLKYIKEECSFDLLLIKKYFSFLVYPGQSPEAQKYVDEKLIKKQPVSLWERLVIDFKR